MANLQAVKAFELPKLRTIVKANPTMAQDEPNQFWDVKFYPYDPAPVAESEPIFAAVNQTNVLVCRISNRDENVVSVIQTLATEGTEEEKGDETDCINSCCWAFIHQQEPLLIAAGDSGLLQVFDAIKGTLFTTLVGHGRGTINDLATHPIYPWIVVSASMDTSLRIWDLRRWNMKHESPCVIICGHNNGHKEGILSVSWHSSGRYLLSGGHDHRICVWTLPDLSPESKFWEEISPSQRKRSSDEVRIIHYPHFITSAVHSNFVDRAAFYGDDIISKAAEEFKIVYWRITGFNSHLPPPDVITAPKAEEHLETRNGFMRTVEVTAQGVTKIDINPAFKDEAPYVRMLEFGAPHCKYFYMRFGFLMPCPAYPDLHPILALGNNKSQIYFWDLERLEIGHGGPVKEQKQSKSQKSRPSGSKSGFSSAILRKKGIARPVNRTGSGSVADRGSSETGTTTPFESATPSSPASSRHSSSTGTGTRTGSFPPIPQPAQSDQNRLIFGARKTAPGLMRSAVIGLDARSPSINPSTQPTIPDQNKPLAGNSSTSIVNGAEEFNGQLIEPEVDRVEYPLHLPHVPLKAHNTITLSDFNPRNNPFTARAADWSADGKWCVVVGQGQGGVGVMTCFSRWC